MALFYYLKKLLAIALITGTVDEDESTFFVDSLFEKIDKKLISSIMFYYKGSETLIVTPETIDKYKD